MAIPNIIFSKQLSNTDIEERLAIPTENLDDFPAIPEGDNHVFVPVMDEDGRGRNFRLSKRREGPNPKPVISSEDWNNYVRENQLRKGDIITFYRENGEDNEEIIRIRVSQRAVKLFGVVIGHKVRRGGHPKPVFSSEDNKDNDGNNGGGGGGGSGGNNKKESRDREGDYNGDKDKRGRDDGGGDVTGKNMDFMGGAFFGYKFGYHAGYENGYPVGQLKCVLVVQ